MRVLSHSVRYSVFAAAAVVLLVCQAAAKTPAQTQSKSHIKTVWIILMENRNWSEIKGSPSAPYINRTLLPIASHAEQYYNPPKVHPSLPNYLWLEAGTDFGIDDDDPPHGHKLATTEHLATLLKNADISWKSYQEDIAGNRCPLRNVYPYGVRHNPFVYFEDVTDHRNPNSAYCIDHIRPFSELDKDLAENHVARYNFITPNVCNDMHDRCKPLKNEILQGDTWLSRHLPPILNSAAYKDGGAVFITWDEAALADGPIGMIVLSPLAKGKGYSNSIRYDHSSMLRTLQEILGVKPYLRNAAGAKDLRDLFTVFP